MRVTVSSVFVLIIIISFDSCFEAPRFAAKPEIEFNNLIFRKGVKTNPLITPADSLILTLNFKDGDGDLGLSGEPPDTDPPSPYVDKYYFRLDGSAKAFPAGTDLSLVITDPGQAKLLSYKIKRTIPAYDTLPDLVTPYTCTNWDIIRDTSQNHTILDTIYFQFNPYHYNIFVDFYIKRNGSDDYDLYDWKSVFIYPNCQVNGFNGRFPILSKDLSQSSAQEGKIRYSMRSVAFTTIFSIKTLRLHVWILDRKLHKSNVVITDAFQLQSILTP